MGFAQALRAFFTKASTAILIVIGFVLIFFTVSKNKLTIGDSYEGDGLVHADAPTCTCADSSTGSDSGGGDGGGSDSGAGGDAGGAGDGGC